ncbi:hypothetical protein ASD64_00960 [Mesorhizobium sp. Root157]|uniref:hypothetical protein n=1 Tax=Mesorhizobium sp. Root157 TaxID=1736477 RepID=UPI0006FC3997|nr:hypothetical protein [Mesorhizobium sp. Root157]KRA00177.1 hypothetical protein ASD64_00960 [Mesorhizobium sp. Root157]
MALCLAARVAITLLPIIVCSACVSDPGAKATDKSLKAVSADGSQAVAIVTEEEVSQPGTATYNCADGGMMTIQNLGASVRILGPDGVAEELQASPSNQRSRYGQAHDAIVLDGREALVVKAGQTPLTCMR